MAQHYKLHYAPDNASLVVRLTLDELQVPYTTCLVDRRRNAHKSEDYLKLNPNGLIPVLETGTQVLFETAAILLWLADTHGALAPAPTSPERGRFLTWLFFTSNTLHADLRKTFYPAQYVGVNATAQAHLNAGLIERLKKHLETVETIAAERPIWLSPEAPSVLSYYIACLLRWAALYPTEADKSWFDLESYPALHTLLSALETRDAVVKAQQMEGLGPTPFTKPVAPNPPEGSAT